MCSSDLSERVVRLPGQQNEQVDVRVREEIAAAVAADCHESQLRRHLNMLPEREQGGIDEPSMIVQQLRGRWFGKKPVAQQGALLGQPALQTDADGLGGTGRSRCGGLFSHSPP